MCNIAAYIGNERAAPILIEMLRKQEGYDSGFFTGMATIHNGKIHMRKVVGDLEHLLGETDAADLPGTIGFIHGRTPGFGDASWAHPFWSNKQDFAMILNGTNGQFNDPIKRNKKCKELEQHGYVFRTGLSDERDGGIRLQDGRRIHGSELSTYLVNQHIEEKGDIAVGMRDAFDEIPGEFVSLLLHQDHPDRLYISRISMPMMIAHNTNELFAASAAFAFPDDRDIYSILSLQPKTVNTISLDRIESIEHNIKKPVIHHLPWITGEAKIIEVLKNQGPMNMGHLREQLNPIWPQDMIPQKNHLLYHLLPDMQKRGVITFRNTYIPGMTKDLKAPSIEISLNC